MLYSLGDMTEHLGQWELLSSGAMLFDSPMEQRVLAIHHGHGVGFDVPAEIAHSPAREYSPVEVRAMVWKCRMHKSSPESIQSLLQKLPEECINEMVERFRERQVAGASTSAPNRSYFIIRRGALNSHKIKAVQQFLDWTKATYAEAKDGANMKMGIIPCGWFVAYVRAHPELLKACRMSATDSIKQRRHDYRRIQKCYARAVKAFVSDSAVVERRIRPLAATESATVGPDPTEGD